MDADPVSTDRSERDRMPLEPSGSECLDTLARRATADFLATEQGKLLIKVAKGYRAIDPSGRFLSLPTGEQLAEQAMQHLIEVGFLPVPGRPGRIDPIRNGTA